LSSLYSKREDEWCAVHGAVEAGMEREREREREREMEE
jgi:hypothetical protein